MVMLARPPKKRKREMAKSSAHAIEASLLDILRQGCASDGFHEATLCIAVDHHPEA